MRRLKMLLDGYQSTTIPAIDPSDYINARVMSGGGVESETVPTGAKIVLFSATGNFYLRTGGAAAVPSADVTNGTGSELNPLARLVTPGETLSLAAPAGKAVIITMAYYK